ncbi:hypothetical protein BLOT_008794 [Blomia tropicalis]|nr:hypothetical protein BLOT_008794 [Blomia tropicalis]
MNIVIHLINCSLCDLLEANMPRQLNRTENNRMLQTNVLFASTKINMNLPANEQMHSNVHLRFNCPHFFHI